MGAEEQSGRTLVFSLPDSRDRYGLAMSLAYPSGEEWGILLVQIISTCTFAALRKGGGVRTQNPMIFAFDIFSSLGLGGGDVNIYSIIR